MVIMEARGRLQGPRPAAVLTVSNNSRNMKKKQEIHGHGSEPVIVYLKSPKVIHVRPEEFMGLVQQLTGNRSSSSSSLSVSSADYISLSSSSSSIEDSSILRLAPPTIPSTS